MKKLAVFGGLALLTVCLGGWSTPTSMVMSDRNAGFFLICRSGTIEAVKQQLASGKKADAKGSYGHTALMWAARLPNRPEVVKALLEAGADAALKDKAGHDALWHVQNSKRFGPTSDAEIWAQAIIQMLEEAAKAR